MDVDIVWLVGARAGRFGPMPDGCVGRKRTAPERVGSLGVARVVTPQVAKGQARVAGFLRARTLGIRLVRTDGRKRRLT